MTITEYYKILELPFNASEEDIKKAYRKKARLFHPDVNHSAGAKDMFILVTEAYDFLISHHGKTTADGRSYEQIMEEWRKYRQDRTRQRARAYSDSSYASFKSTSFYKSTRILDGTTIIISFAMSVMVFIYTIFGFFFRLKHPADAAEKPPIFTFLFLLTLSVILFTVSFIYLRSFIRQSKKRKKGSA
ncbi:MAG: J domain-containing protein [Bacteroidales bacterium]